MRFDFVLSEGLAVELLEQGKTTKEISDFFAEANKREDNLEFIVDEHRRLLKNRKD